jgi:tripartite-type tricarboxylate transporter receptor subunit TctC
MKCLAAIALAVLALCARANAQTYPSRPVRMIVPTAGGGGDNVARVMAQKLSEQWSYQVVVDNRTGIIGPEIVAHAAPDGHTIMMTTSTFLFREAITPVMSVRLQDFAAITQIVRQALVLVVNPALPAKSVAEFVALAKARPGQLNFGSGTPGSAGHLASELFRLLAGVRVVHVPYKGTAFAITDLAAGRLQFVFGTPESMLPLVNEGRLRLLAVTSARRTPSMPEVPTVAESGVPNYEFAGWIGVFVPKAVPAAVTDKLRASIAGVLAQPEVRQKFEAHASEVVANSPEEFTRYLAAELSRWKKIAADANIRAE